jgi:anti-anti-sigma factor
MGNAFAGLDLQSLLGVVLDGQLLSYINTSGLASLAAHAKRIQLQVCRVSEPVRRVFDIVGLMPMLNVHATMPVALEQLELDFIASKSTNTDS